ncbi:MAG TPA: methylated-DNA--[protein]-cysteine S-methyltransferase [bacterium]|nr:methylated-DNA--[protein]-cysteine S-methyltransferase [bacterium]
MPSSDFHRVEKVIQHLERHWKDQPSLEELARVVDLSSFHFQRLFQRWAGVSPKKFVQYLTIENAKQRLRESRSVLDAAYDTGLSSPGRLHDLFVSVEAMSPGEYKSGGKGMTIGYGFHETPFGEALIALTVRGICGFSFVGKGGRDEALGELKRHWAKAVFQLENQKTNEVIQRLFRGQSHSNGTKLLLRGTPFQIKVWEALLRIAPGSVLSYQDVAERVGCSKAARAVGTAIGRNVVAYLIPCHRVIRESGVVGEYRWGSVRKKAILAWEGAK